MGKKITCQLPMYINRIYAQHVEHYNRVSYLICRGRFILTLKHPLQALGGGVQALDKGRVKAHWNLVRPSTSLTWPITFELDPSI